MSSQCIVTTKIVATAMRRRYKLGVALDWDSLRRQSIRAFVYLFLGARETGTHDGKTEMVINLFFNSSKCVMVLNYLKFIATEIPRRSEACDARKRVGGPMGKMLLNTTFAENADNK